MKCTLALLLGACSLVAGSANAKPPDGAPKAFATLEECTAVLYTLTRGNNALYCVLGSNGWYMDFDDSYKEVRKGPRN